jgi:hypothetical protein
VSPRWCLHSLFHAFSSCLGLGCALCSENLISQASVGILESVAPGRIRIVKAGMKNKVILQLLCFKDRVLKLTAETRVMIDKKAKTVEREKIFFNLK